MRLHVRRRIGAAAMIVALFVAPTFSHRQMSAREPVIQQADQRAIRQATDAYVAAVNQGDPRAVAEHWTEDGDFVDDAGRLAKGRRPASEEQVAEERDSKLSVSLESIRAVTPDVAIAEGTARFTPTPEGRHPITRFTAVWVRRDGQWLIDAVRESPFPPTEHYARLTEIEWMVGEWFAGEGEAARMSCDWSADKNFLLREIRMKAADGKDLSISQRIGWDPATERIKSWAFDARGAYGEAFWARDGDTWVVESKGVLPGGERFTGTHVYTFVDEDTFTWESLDGRIGDSELPNSTTTFVRRPADKTP